MEVYALEQHCLEMEWKADLSPVTLADRYSNEYIINQLAMLDSSIPIISEESVQLPFAIRKEWTRYWCLDPLDGTKEFIKRSDQFTINLALMEHSLPSIGFIHLPVLGHTYWAMKGHGAFLDDGVSTNRIWANNKLQDWISIGSNSHVNPHESEVLRQFPITEFMRVGSALKFCRIASGEADIYYRKGPTMEWDTAAGHVLVEEAGAVFKYLSETKTHYNKESLLNPSFLAHIQS